MRRIATLAFTATFDSPADAVDKMRKTQGFPSSSPQVLLRTVETEPDRAAAAGIHTRSGGDIVATYEVTFKDSSVEVIEGADAYQQEGPMTTFFETGEGRRVVDCWSTRLASFRTSEVVIIRRITRELPRVEPCAVLDLQTEGGPASALAYRSAS